MYEILSFRNNLKRIFESFKLIPINPHYSCKNEVNCVNERWIVGCNAGNPELV